MKVTNQKNLAGYGPAPVGFIQIDRVWYFTSGPGTRKSRNLADNPRYTVSVATHPFDLAPEGSAARVTDSAELHSVADKFGHAGWPVRMDGDALTADYGAPSAGPGGATRYDL